MIAVALVRAGRLEPGSSDVASLGDQLWVIGDGVSQLREVPPTTARLVECGSFRPATWASWLANEAMGESIVLPATPDGRDLAAMVAAQWDVTLYAGCLELSATEIVTPRYGSSTTVVQRPAHRYVATVQVRSAVGVLAPVSVEVERAIIPEAPDCEIVESLEPDPATIDLADARLIVGGGAGLSRAEEFDTLASVARGLGASMGATRVITDRGWVSHRRQIGTTGVTVSPELYVAFGISGAVQHTSGLGAPEHVISVNFDANCPMSQMADLVVVADANAVVRELAQQLESP